MSYYVLEPSRGIGEDWASATADVLAPWRSYERYKTSKEQTKQIKAQRNVVAAQEQAAYAEAERLEAEAARLEAQMRAEESRSRYQQEERAQRVELLRRLGYWGALGALGWVLVREATR